MLPMIAVVFPGSALKLKPEIAFSLPPSNLNETFLNSTTPLQSVSFLSVFSVSALSVIVSLVFKTSSIRSAATPALGSMTDIIVIIRNAMTICIV